jgi:Domain of unknown function (DUF4440)
MTDAAIEAELTQLEARRGAALVNRDAAQLDALFSDELVHIHSTGNQMNKAELMHYVMQTLQFLSVQRSDLKVRVYGNCAVMTGRMFNTMRRFDKTETVSADAWVTQVWVSTSKGWQQVSFQATRAAAPATT